MRDDIHIRDRTFERKYSLVLTILQVIQSVVEVVAVAYLGGGGDGATAPFGLTVNFWIIFALLL